MYLSTRTSVQLFSLVFRKQHDLVTHTVLVLLSLPQGDREAQGLELSHMNHTHVRSTTSAHSLLSPPLYTLILSLPVKSYPIFTNFLQTPTPVRNTDLEDVAS